MHDVDRVGSESGCAAMVTELAHKMREPAVRSGKRWHCRAARGKEGRSRSVGGEVKVTTGHGVSICGELIFTELGT